MRAGYRISYSRIWFPATRVYRYGCELENRNVEWAFLWSIRKIIHRSLLTIDAVFQKEKVEENVYYWFKNWEYCKYLIYYCKYLKLEKIEFDRSRIFHLVKERVEQRFFYFICVCAYPFINSWGYSRSRINFL